MKTVVSVIIRNFNRELTLRNTLESLLLQTYKNFEIVCIDDASTDNTKEIISQFASKYDNIKAVYNKENKGSSHSFNEAIVNCNGEIILPINGDIALASNFIEKGVFVLNNKPEVGIVYSNIDFNKRLSESEFISKTNILYTIMFRKTDFINAGKYKTYLTDGCEEYDLWINIMDQGFESYNIKTDKAH